MNTITITRNSEINNRYTLSSVWGKQKRILTTNQLYNLIYWNLKEMYPFNGVSPKARYHQWLSNKTNYLLLTLSRENKVAIA